MLEMDLSLDLCLVYVPKTISEFLQQVSEIKDWFQRLSMIGDYVQRLEDEMKKIDAFKRELPLCMLLLKDGIQRLKDEERQSKEMNDGSVLPLKGSSEEDGKETVENDGGDMKNWMSSVQLWSSDFNNVDRNKKPSAVPELKMRSEEQGGEEEDLSKNPIELCNKKRKGAAFVPFKEYVDKKISALSLMTQSSDLSSCSLKNNGGCRIGSGSSVYTQNHHQQQNSRKQRRCWSPELHRRFVEALQQLGGSQVATPKQMRELMQVEGLTNDEVKSHLQKYRLHIRKRPGKETSHVQVKTSPMSTVKQAFHSLVPRTVPSFPVVQLKICRVPVATAWPPKMKNPMDTAGEAGFESPERSVYSQITCIPHEFCRNMGG